MLPKGQIISINAQGVENSFRNKKDGITYFGCKKRLKRISKQVRVLSHAVKGNFETKCINR